MNNKHQENAALTDPLIFTLPVFSLNLDCSMGPDGQPFLSRRAAGSGIGSNLHHGSSKNPSPKHIFRRGQRTNCCGALVTVTNVNEGFDNSYSKSTINH